MNTNKTLSIKVKSKTNHGLDGEPEVEMISEWDLKKIIYAVIAILIFIVLPAYYFNIQDDNDTTKLVDTVHIEAEAKQIGQGGSTDETQIEQVPPQTLAKEIAVKEAPLSEKKKTEAVLVEEPTIQAATDNPAVYIDTEPKTLVIDKKEQHLTPPKAEQLNPHIARAQLAIGINKLKPYGKVELPFLVENSKTRGLYFFTEIINMQGSAVFHEWLREGKSIYKRKIIIRGDRWRFYTSKLFTKSSVGQWQVRVITKQGEVLHKINFSVEKR